jgi:hypothetical protein
MTDDDPHAGHSCGLVVVRLESAGLVNELICPRRMRFGEGWGQNGRRAQES